MKTRNATRPEAKAAAGRPSETRRSVLVTLDHADPGPE